MRKKEVELSDRELALCLSAESAELRRISTLTDLGRHRGFHEQLALGPDPIIHANNYHCTGHDCTKFAPPMLAYQRV